MITKFIEIEKLFEEIAEDMNEVLNLYIIGGVVLLEQGLKDATKDIDLVVANKNDFIYLQKALERSGFKARIPDVEYKHMNLSQILERREFRIDLFEREVCGKFVLSEKMMKRARKVRDMKYLKVFLCANEDIFLFKCMTEREGDLNDCLSLAQRNLNWEEILKELKDQVEKSGEDVWITWVGERFDMLEEKALRIPIMKDINKLRERFFEKYEAEKIRAEK